MIQAWFWRRWAVLALMLGAGAAPGAAHSGDTLRVGGRDYVPLAQWAAVNGLAVHWVKRDETLELTGGSARLKLAVDSRTAGFNGIEVWLCFPVLLRNGSLYLAQTDAASTLRPLLAPPRERSGARLRVICLDPGHGGKDPGYCVGAYQEKTYTLLLAQELRDQLKRAGFKVSLTRTGDRFIELPDRPALAKKRKADLFLSLHFNAAETGRDTVQGAQVFCLTPAGASSTNTRGETGDASWCPGNRNNEKNLYLAYQIQRALRQGLGVEDRGVRRARFAVLRDAAMPAALLEAGFMSHPVEGRKIFTAAYRRQLAQAIVAGITRYKKAVEDGNS